MMWQVRGTLEDRPGAMAALAARCGRESVNILGLQIFPAADGRVVDELVLYTPGGWTAQDVEDLCDAAGVSAARVAPCSPHALEDQPVRFLRSAQVVTERPELLEEQLCRLLDGTPGTAGPHTMSLDDAEGPSVALSREIAFTDAEVARASELRRLVAVALGVVADPAPDVEDGTPGEAAILVRPGSVEDAAGLVAMHARCSAETTYRRYHAPVPHLSPRLARSLLAPTDGVSLVAVVGGEIVATAMVAGGADGAELGLIVEDRMQRRGIGARLLRAIATEAAARGLDALTCQVQPDNDAVLRTIHRAGLRVRVAWVDGLARYTIPVAGLAGAGRRRGNRPAMGQVTAPLVELLHQRSELREVHPAADLIDQAVRGGA